VYLIAGLGNPGPKYRNTRHNIGFRVVNAWAKSMGVRLKGRHFDSRNIRINYQSRDLILLRPTTFMNLSGRSIRACVDYFNLQIGKILVVHDDIDLPVGRIRVARNGGPGGHKGVQSVIEHLGSRDFHRVKIGIGRPLYGESVEAFVLSAFYSEEKKTADHMVSWGMKACQLFVSEGLETAMNRMNSQNLSSKEVMN
jgi:PTH1 family peptidyl-tRNA hydrolase